MFYGALELGFAGLPLNVELARDLVQRLLLGMLALLARSLILGLYHLVAYAFGTAFQPSKTEFIKEMASNNKIFSCEDPNPPNLKQISEVMDDEGSRSENSKRVRRQKRPKAWNSQRYSIPLRGSRGSVSSSKSKLYAQPCYIGPTGFKPFSTFKRLTIAEEEQDEEGFPTALCRSLGCWQTEPHSHGAPVHLESDYYGYSSRDIQGRGDTSDMDLPRLPINQKLSAESLQRPPSPLVAGPASTSERIVKPLPIRSHKNLNDHASRTPQSSSVQNCSHIWASSSLSNPNQLGLSDLRNALPQLSTSHKSSTSPMAQSIGWQVDLPIHQKPRSKRDHDEQTLDESESVIKRQRIAKPATLPTTLPKERFSGVTRRLEKLRLTPTRDAW
ncbi:MAG: hypothetical protein Q9191_000769 [Dirinaria sp. TL-2023a]